MQAFEHWHFIRPLWLLSLPISLSLVWMFYRYQQQNNAWQKWISPELLKTLTVGKNSRQKIGFYSLLLLLIIASIALAGPSVKQQIQPVSKNQDALVVVLDLSLSMLAEDEQPSRLIKAKRKITDVLNARKDGQTALVVYSGDAHAVTPLSDDVQTLKHLLKAVKPQIMPNFGSNAEQAFTLAQQLIFNSGQTQGKILWLGDEVNAKAMSFIGQNIKPDIQLQFIAFGTEQGAPIILPNGFLKDANNHTVIAQVPIKQWQSLATNHGFGFYQNQLNNQDFTAFIEQKISQRNIESQQKTKVSVDAGPWLVLCILPLFLLLFRKNAVFLSLVLLLGVQVDNSAADVLPEFLKNNNQKGYNAYQAKDYEKSEQFFDNPKWRASSLYQRQKFSEAAEIYQKFDDADSLYNLGNSYAKMGEAEKAIANYEKALEKQPDHKDAQSNKALVEQLKEQQEKEQQSSDDADDNQKKSDDSKEQQSDKQSSDDQDSQSQQGSDSDTKSDKNSEKASDESQNQDSEPSDSDEKEPKNEQKPQKSEAGDPEQTDKQGAKAQLSPLEKEQQQALEQWLKKIPDDPSGYLKNKFNYQYQQQRRQQQPQASDKIW